MEKLWVLWAVRRLAISFLTCSALVAAETALLSPLTYTLAPPCSKRPGVRTTRSDLVRFGEVTASLTAQATHEGGTCIQSASLWVTQEGTSQQLDLPDVTIEPVGIVDIAPDSSGLLLVSGARVAFVSLSDGSMKWIRLADILGLGKCDVDFLPQGFADATHLVIAAVPRAAKGPQGSCPAVAAFYSIDNGSHDAKAVGTAPAVTRYANAIPLTARPCRGDPDVIGACYRARARLEISNKGDGLLVWPVGGTRVMAVEEDMLPAALRARVSPDMRVYANMVICPVVMERPSRYAFVCVDSATGIKGEAATVSHPEP
jgi:hypothetical protein